MNFNYIPFIAALCTTLLSCSRELDLEHKFDNSNSSRPKDEIIEEIEDTKDYLDKGILLMSPRTDLKIKDGVPRKDFLLDGKISVIKFKGQKNYTTFWSGNKSYMQEGCESPYLENNVNRLQENMAVIGKGITSTEGFSDGGQWMIGVHELPDGRLAGFFHSESHWKGCKGAYKSIGLAYSDNNGKTWTKGSKIISGSDPKPARPEDPNSGKSYGLGDGCSVWNEARQSWIVYYSGFDGRNYRISMAESKDPAAKAGTWKKWDGSDFTVEACNQKTGLGGPNVAIKNLSSYAGGNPSVTWNTHLEKWIMFYHSWQKAIVMSTSADGITWDKPVLLVDLNLEPGGSMYPNIVGEHGDLTTGQSFRLYYAADMNNFGQRKTAMRKIQLK